MKHLIIAVFILCFTGCVPQKTETEWKSQPEYRAFIATRMAESVIDYKEDVDEETVEELCDGSGWIVHGDGHKTECPGCAACENKDGQEPVVVEPEPVEVQDCPDPTSNSQPQPQRKGVLKRLFGK